MPVNISLNRLFGQNLPILRASASLEKWPIKPIQLASSDGWNSGVVKNSRGPFHRVDFCHDRTIDEPCGLENLVIGELRLILFEVIADRVVFLGEEGVENFEAQPPVVGKSANGAPVLGSLGRKPLSSRYSLPPEQR
jgi:hypothetical protein